ncbi:transketolase [Abditibacterium utsteinense]|uniref:Transketolase n=1 Tax=Abditibacterium utsteinense TaxID=1960156 RepID=A0A2S8SUR2_9BACT|nr:transketolase [Abditibacterium utsteinense]PQV64537.1 transketolase [Abditibacterium utsteinense]
MNQELLQRAANQARGLAMDAVHKSNSGHLGLPLGCAEIGATLYGYALQIDPAHPRWLNRDRFVLSAGHGSMFLYSWLHIAGYDLSIEEVANFRQFGSKTPGHPEFRETPGVEATTGPLGQGIGNAVGYALSQKRAATKFNTAQAQIFDNHVIALCGDGCLQEGVGLESVTFAGHVGLDNLILIFDANGVTLDAMAEVTQSENKAEEFEALGWDVTTIDGHNFDEILAAIEKAKGDDNDKPKFIIAKTQIGRGIAEVQGTQKAHGEGGAKFIDAARLAFGFPADENFYISPEVSEYFGNLKQERAENYKLWEQKFEGWKKDNADLAKELEAHLSGDMPADLLSKIPEYPLEGKSATRNCGGEIFNVIANEVSSVITGSADLYGSTKNYLKGMGDFQKNNVLGRNIWFGIREHAMGSILNGIAYDGFFHASGATFLVFADYCRPAIRLASLSHLPVLYIFTHDSIGVGEDGPTHQPVETVSALRLIPNLDVIRPADAEETAGAFVAALERKDGPTLLALTRQDVPFLGFAPAQLRREGAFKGAYILVKETAELETILIATGSEVQLAVEAAKTLGAGTRVVSMPSTSRFDRQSAEYKAEILPANITKRVAIEAGVTEFWWKYVGLGGAVVGIDRFGISAPAPLVFKELGITAEHVIAAAKGL